MAWSDPGDFTSGQILTAAQMDSVREAMFFGQATFTNEAARDAAIPAAGIALQEGMRAYLTAPTVPAATGDSTGVPSGVTTVYNGSVWVCTTPVGSRTDAFGTTTSGSYTPTLSGSPGTNPSVTLVTGTSAIVTASNTSSISNAANFAAMSFAVSGATTIAATDDYTLSTQLTAGSTLSRSLVLTGLTAGTNTFTLQYRTNATGEFGRRNLIVSGIA
jgi:hypothetical protein